MNKQWVVCLPRLLRNRYGCRVGQAVAWAGDEILEHVIGVQRKRLLAFVEDAPARQCGAVETHCHEAAGDGLSGGGERLLALALAKIELRLRRHRHLNDAVGQLPRTHLVEPGAIQRRMVRSHLMKDLLPDGGFQTNWLLSAATGVARERHVGRCHDGS